MDRFRYGLIIPKKQQTVAPRASNIFADDNSSDEDDGTDWVKKALKAEGEKNKMKKQTKLNMQKALKEDPTIYQYDEVYDDMERTKNETKAGKQEEKKKPKYIQNLLLAAERRKKEQEHRIERMVQKEREAEGNMYADKESFVTSAYRAKLEEFKKMEEEESRMSRLEAIGDVTKQQDMSGFYRHLYQQTVEDPTKVENPKESRTPDTNDKDSTHDSVSNTHSTDDKKKFEKEVITTVPSREKDVAIKVKKSRQYRQRVVEEEDSESETEIKQELQNEDKDKDKDKTVVSPTNLIIDKVDTKQPNNKRQKQESEDHISDKAQDEAPASDDRVTSPKSSQNASESCNETNKEGKPDVSVNVKKVSEKKEKSRIWEKRTVGPVFEAALQRYYTRKAMRLSGTQPGTVV